MVNHNPRFDDYTEVRCNFCGHTYRVEGGFLVDDRAAWKPGEDCLCGEPLSWYCVTDAREWDGPRVERHYWVGI